jgi:hypothetical protein
MNLVRELGDLCEKWISSQNQPTIVTVSSCRQSSAELPHGLVNGFASLKVARSEARRKDHTEQDRCTGLVVGLRISCNVSLGIDRYWVSFSLITTWGKGAG